MVKELREYFAENYSHIAFELTDKELSLWLKERPYLKDKPIELVADCLSDYLLAIGAEAVE